MREADVVDEVQADFFISYTAADQKIAEWIAWELEEAGYQTVIQAWDFRPGLEFITGMQSAHWCVPSGCWRCCPRPT